MISRNIFSKLKFVSHSREMGEPLIGKASLLIGFYPSLWKPKFAIQWSLFSSCIQGPFGTYKFDFESRPQNPDTCNCCLEENL